MKRDVFIETSNVTRFGRAMDVLCDTQKGEAGMCVVEGASGRGKTLTSNEWHANNNSIFLRVLEGWTQFEFLRELTWELVGIRPGSRGKCRQELRDCLGDRPQPIIVDEADRLALQRIEDLRDIHDLTGSPVIMIGEEGFYNKINGKKRVQSRITQLVKFSPVISDDVVLFAHKSIGVALAPEAADWLTKKAGGCFRDIFGYMYKIEDWAKAQGTNQISLDIIKKIKLGGFN